jgi:hypothetical protein
MPADLEELYQSIILDHNRRPQNFRVIENATAHAEGLNPMCGISYRCGCRWMAIPWPMFPFKAPDARYQKRARAS